MQAESFDRVIARLDIGFLREDIDPVLRCVREDVAAASELLDRADHAVGLNAAELACLDLDAARHSLASVVSSGDASAVEDDRNHHVGDDIRRAGDDLDRLSFADIDHADNQLVGVRVLFDRENFSDDDLVETVIKFLEFFNLCPGERHRVRVFARGHVQIRNIIFDP